MVHYSSICPILVGLLFIVASSAEDLPNGCPSDNQVYRLLPHETECSKFYQCSNGQKIEMGCATGTVFNPAISVCDWPQAVECPAPATEATTEKEDRTTTEDTSIIKTTAVEEPEENISVETTTIKALCSADAFGNVPHPYLCDTFYMCVGGNAIQLYCSAGFEYDIEQEQCAAVKEGGCTDLQGLP